MGKTSKPEPVLLSVAEYRNALEIELQKWTEAGRKPRLFLRDDDAIEVTPALEQLIAVIEKFDAPLLLATIPSPAKPELGRRLADHPLVTPAVHGYEHRNHSPKGEKTCELSRHRPPEVLLREFSESRQKLGEIFDGRLSGLLVPPWNRIHDEVYPLAVEAGFEGVSAHAWLKQPMPMTMVNTHVDIMHWSGGKVGRELNWIFHHLVENLRTARDKDHRAIGILTHHLVHDEKAWSGLDSIFSTLEGKVSWVHADDLLHEPPEPI